MAMIGRASFGDPWIFMQAEALLNGQPEPERPPLSKRVDVAVEQFEIAARYKGERTACLEARKHYAWYLKGVPYSGYFKEKITHIETMQDIYDITAGIKRELR
jgi:tRNA-dihydrouridine synthase B